MCFMSAPKTKPPAPLVTASSDEARRTGDLEAAIRRRRAGAAADVLNGRQGAPTVRATTTLGGVAA